MRSRSALVGVVLLAGALIGSCSSTGGEAVAGDVTVVVTQVTTLPESPGPESPEPDSPAPTTTATPPPSPSPSPTPTPTSSTPSSSSTSSSSAAASTTDDSETEPSTTTRASSLSTGKRPVASWLGDPPADPDTPGPEGGPTCSANAEYVNEAPDGLADDVIVAWRTVVAKGKKSDLVVCLNDGKRSRAQQQAQFDDYVEQYGEEVAEQLVLPPDRSAHVLGVAVDVQPAEAYQWLQATKGSLGFCRIYDNEPWHFEYDPAFVAEGCPDRLPQPER